MAAKVTSTPRIGGVLGDIELELNVLIFTMLINMGFLKLTEVSTFIKSTINTVSALHPQSINFWQMMLVVVAVIAYFCYVVAIFVGVLFTFLKNKNPRRAMCTCLISFFVVYTCVFLSSLSPA